MATATRCERLTDRQTERDKRVPQPYIFLAMEYIADVAEVAAIGGYVNDLPAVLDRLGLECETRIETSGGEARLTVAISRKGEKNVAEDMLIESSDGAKLLTWIRAYAAGRVAAPPASS